MTRTLALLVVLSMMACVEKTDEAAAVDMEQVKSLVSTQAPLPQHALDIQFEGKISLIGYDVNVTEITPGQPFEITWYWKTEKALEEGWRLFTHIADARGESRLNADLFGPIRQAYQPGQWKSGEYVRDTQSITLPPNWNSPAAKILIGIWNGPHRLQISRGQADNENRAQVVTIKVASHAVAERPAVLNARKVTAPIVIDGKLDEADWVASRATLPLVNPMNGADGAFETKVRVLYDAERVYFGYEVKDSFLRSTFTQADEHLWEQDTIEVMLDPDGDAKNYFEVQVSPQGVVFDTRYDTVRQPRPFGDVAWSSQANAKVVTAGTANDDENDQGYVVEFSMPWTAFAVGATPASPPQDGGSWRINFYVMDSQRDAQRAVAWSAPRVPDFHTPNRFGTVIFGDLPAPVTTVEATNAAVVPGNAPTTGSAPTDPASTTAAPSAASNTPMRPREIAAGRTEIELSPGTAEAMRARAKAAAGLEVTTPPKVHAH